jgi:hypothetical protein
MAPVFDFALILDRVRSTADALPRPALHRPTSGNVEPMSQRHRTPERRLRGLLPDPSRGTVRTDPDFDRLPVDDARALAGEVGAARIMVGAAWTLAGTDRSLVGRAERKDRCGGMKITSGGNDPGTGAGDPDGGGDDVETPADDVREAAPPRSRRAVGQPRAVRGTAAGRVARACRRQTASARDGRAIDGATAVSV